MKKLSLIVFILVVALFVTDGRAIAVPFADGGSGLQAILDSITVGPTSGSSSVDVTTDELSDLYDSYWNTTASGGSISTMIIELTSFGTTLEFGIYDPNDPTSLIVLFDSSASAGSMVTLAITAAGDIYINGSDTGIDLASGTSFGYYVTDGTAVWYSDSDLNSGTDYMVAYQGTDTDTVQIGPWAPGVWTDNEYVLGFEADSGIVDYTDMVVMVESVQPVPEPTTMILLGTGLLGLAGFGRKKLFNKNKGHLSS